MRLGRDSDMLAEMWVLMATLLVPIDMGVVYLTLMIGPYAEELLLLTPVRLALAYMLILLVMLVVDTDGTHRNLSWVTGCRGSELVNGALILLYRGTLWRTLSGL